jgi:hypothetical protein
MVTETRPRGGPALASIPCRSRSNFGGGRASRNFPYLPAHNERFAVKAAESGLAFTPIAGVNLDKILWMQEEHQVGNDNCVSRRTFKLQIAASPMRAHLNDQRCQKRSLNQLGWSVGNLIRFRDCALAYEGLQCCLDFVAFVCGRRNVFVASLRQ